MLIKKLKEHKCNNCNDVHDKIYIIEFVNKEFMLCEDCMLLLTRALHSIKERKSVNAYVCITDDKGYIEV